MVYLDYSATTKTREEVLDTYITTSRDYFANPNSLHKIGVEAKHLIDASTEQIARIMNCDKEEVIYTSCASESNNLALKGVALRNKKRGMHIISTNLEHSSIYGPLGYLSNLGFEIDFVKTNSFGLVDIEDLKRLLKDDTILVSIGAVNSETGVKQNIEEIANLLKSYNCYFHVDATQAVGKVRIDYKNVDLISFTAHKFYGPKGVGVLIKRKDILMEPLIHGGKSTTVYRSGTPVINMITSTSVALEKALRLLEERNEYIQKLNNKVISTLKEYKNVHINNTDKSIPHTINVSIKGVKSDLFASKLNENSVMVSTKTSCCPLNTPSKLVYALTKDKSLASTSIRISLSHLTTESEIDEFLKIFDKCYKEMV